MKKKESAHLAHFKKKNSRGKKQKKKTNLLSEHGLSLSTESGLLAVITTLS